MLKNQQTENDRNNNEASIEYLNKYIDQHKGGDNAYNNRGFSLIRLEKYKEALPDLEEAIRIYSKNQYAWSNLGFAKFKLGFVEEGLEHINHSIELDDSNSYVYKNKAIIYLHQGRKADAIELLQKARNLGYQAQYDDEVERLLQRLTSNNDEAFNHFISD